MSRKLALLLGNSTYGPGLPPLEKPDADIAALAKVLADPAIGGFDEVKPLLDANSAAARREVARFFSGRSPDDLLLLYFSGHGLRDDRGGLYLAAPDTETDLLRGTAVPAAYISEEMDNCRSRRQILILDCCYSGAFERGAKGSTANPATAFTGNGLGRFVLTASDSTQLAWEDVAATSKGGLSVFTRHLVAGLESGEADLDGDGFISVDELYDYVYAQVVEENPRQTPGKSTSKQQGEIFLARNPVGSKIRPLPAELMQALEHPLAAVREGAVRELGRYLRGSDAGLAKAARAAAEQARDDDSRRVAMAAAEVLAAVALEQAEPVPQSKPAEPQPAPAPDRNEGGPSQPAPPPSGASGELPHTSRKKASPKPIWIALGVLALLGTVALLISQTNKHFDDEPAEPLPPVVSEFSTQEATIDLLTEAKTWPLVLADSFDSMETSTFTDLHTEAEQGTKTGVITLGFLRSSIASKLKEGTFALFPANLTTPATDFYLKVDLRKSTGFDTGNAGLMFRISTDRRQHYAFEINQNSYEFTAYTSEWRVIRPWTLSAAIHPNQTNSLAVVAKGSDLTLFINDQKVDQVSDATFSSGGVGLGIESHGLGKVTFDFDDFEFRRRP